MFADFAAADCAVLANSRLIAEGVDIPSVDAVVFADPTRSVIRCVQALGRLDVSGKTASLIVPVYVPPGADSEKILGTAYELLGTGHPHQSAAHPCGRRGEGFVRQACGRARDVP
ncbi:helicase-related protein [Streptomyces sp. NPDC060000]|uniref:helicase-related protein n=1 Tax=Streptomyces sp. NPDC060000 TaxID=3347031 RepID=UPI0036CC45A0